MSEQKAFNDYRLAREHAAEWYRLVNIYPEVGTFTDLEQFLNWREQTDLKVPADMWDKKLIADLLASESASPDTSTTDAEKSEVKKQKQEDPFIGFVLVDNEAHTLKPDGTVALYMDEDYRFQTLLAWQKHSWSIYHTNEQDRNAYLSYASADKNDPLNQLCAFAQAKSPCQEDTESFFRTFFSNSTTDYDRHEKIRVYDKPENDPAYRQALVDAKARTRLWINKSQEEGRTLEQADIEAVFVYEQINMCRAFARMYPEKAEAYKTQSSAVEQAIAINEYTQDTTVKNMQSSTSLAERAVKVTQSKLIDDQHYKEAEQKLQQELQTKYDATAQQLLQNKQKEFAETYKDQSFTTSDGKKIPLSEHLLDEYQHGKARFQKDIAAGKIQSQHTEEARKQFVEQERVSWRLASTTRTSGGNEMIKPAGPQIPVTQIIERVKARAPQTYIMFQQTYFPGVPMEEDFTDRIAGSFNQSSDETAEGDTNDDEEPSGDDENGGGDGESGTPDGGTNDIQQIKDLHDSIKDMQGGENAAEGGTEGADGAGTDAAAEEAAAEGAETTAGAEAAEVTNAAAAEAATTATTATTAAEGAALTAGTSAGATGLSAAAATEGGAVVVAGASPAAATITVLIILLFLFLFIIIVMRLFQATQKVSEDTTLPRVVLNKTGPEAVANGTNISYTLTARYAGTADDVIITEPIPDGTEFVSASPQPKLYDAQGNPTTDTSLTKKVEWSLKDIQGNNAAAIAPVNALATTPSTASQSGTTRKFTDQTLSIILHPLSNDTFVINRASGRAVGAISTDPNNPTYDNCGVYNLVLTPIKTNFGDPNCTMLAIGTRTPEGTISHQKDAEYIDKLMQYIKSKDPANIDIWHMIVECESHFNANAYAGHLDVGTPDEDGAWGLLQMGSNIDGPKGTPGGRGKNGVFDRGDVPWELQVTNAINYNNDLAANLKFKYWQCAP